MMQFSWYFFVYPLLLTCYTSCTSETQQLAKDLRFKLHSGDLMPLVGFGSSKIVGDGPVKSSLDLALAAGYRLIDTATVYDNEASIGKALKELLPKHNLTRKDIFITTKLAYFDHDDPYGALQKSLQILDCEYIDLYLIHWPGTAEEKNQERNDSAVRNESWKQLVKGVKNGLTRNIGVSNYNTHHMSELLNNDHGVKPAVNQVEWHPFYHQSELLELLKKEGILLQAYRSLGGPDNPDLLKNSEVAAIAHKLGKSSAQVLLRWNLQQNIAIIPRSQSKVHIYDNIDLNFVIAKEDMDILSNFTIVRKYTWDPDVIV